MSDTNHNGTILEAQNLSRAFKGLHALEGYELKLKPGEILAIIGPNGAGKTTLFNVLTGFLPPTTGKVTFQNQDISGMRPDLVARRGIARTFQTIRLFGGLSVLENAKTGRQLHHPTSFVATVLSLPSFRKNETEIEERVQDLLDLFHLTKYKYAEAKNLPYGDQRRLEIVRALATEPKILCLDEPAAGMNPAETDELVRLIREVRDRFGLTVMLVEHQMRVVMNLAERIQVLSYGKIISEGTPDEVRADATVVEAYLGKQKGYA